MIMYSYIEKNQGVGLLPNEIPGWYLLELYI